MDTSVSPQAEGRSGKGLLVYPTPITMNNETYDRTPLRREAPEDYPPSPAADMR